MLADNYFETLAAELVGNAQEEYVRELSNYFLTRFKDVTRDFNSYDEGKLVNLAALNRAEALRIFGNHREGIRENTQRAFDHALSVVDEDLVDLFTKHVEARPYMTNLAHNIAQQAAYGMTEILERQNIAMAEEQANLWYQVTADAITRAQSGDPLAKVLERGCKRLAEEGIKTIDYVSGTQTSIDAALRRHVVTQANQARNNLLFARMDEWEWDLVFTSAHFGARPSHAEWQGKVYSRSGTSKKYPSLEEATGYGTVTGLCGANCRHTLTPYVEGYSQLPNTDYSMQEKRFGMTSDEYYAATQKQRRLEREIRKVKRERAAIAVDGQETVKQDRRIRELQKRLREHVKENHLTRDYQREKVWGISSKYASSVISRTLKESISVALTHKPNVILDGQPVLLVDRNGFPVTNRHLIDEISKKKLSLSKNKQSRHYPEEYGQSKGNRSQMYLTQEEIIDLVEHSDKPLVFMVKGNQNSPEFYCHVESKKRLGRYIKIDSSGSIEKEADTNLGIVRLSKDGYHIVPSDPDFY